MLKFPPLIFSVENPLLQSRFLNPYRAPRVLFGVEDKYSDTVFFHMSIFWDIDDMNDVLSHTQTQYFSMLAQETPGTSNI